MLILNLKKEYPTSEASKLRETKHHALHSSLEECIRKTAFLESWKNKGFVFYDKLMFWLSPQGEKKMNEMLNISLNHVPINFPLSFDSAKIVQVKIMDHFVSYYNETESLNELMENHIPLL